MISIRRILGSASWLQIGIFAGVASAVLYTAANVQLRRAVEVDPFLVAAVKAAPTVIALAPVLIWYRMTGRPLGSNYAMIPRFALVALIGQFIGNAAFQIALQHIPLAVAVPITLGTLIVAGGLLGWFMLGEPIGIGKGISMALLIAAVFVLSYGDGQTTAELANEDSSFEIVPWWGALCASASGAAYSLFGVVMRRTLNSGLSMPATLMISGVVGTISLWAMTLARLGSDIWTETLAGQWMTMAWAGVFNFAAFVALAAALKFLPVVAVNLINASQVAMAALAGVYFFEETMTRSILIGIAITVLGLLVLTASGYQQRRGERE